MSDGQFGPPGPMDPADTGPDTGAAFDDAVARDDALLDSLAGRQRPAAAGDDQVVVRLLGALAAEADAAPDAAPDQPADEPAAAAPTELDRRRHRRSRRISRAALAGGVAAAVVSIGGVAAAVTGTNPLTPISTVVESVTSGDQPADAGPEVTELVARAEEAAARGDFQEARELAAQCRETLADSSGPEHDALLARVERLTERLATASPSPDKSGTPSPTDPSPSGTESPSLSESPSPSTSSPTATSGDDPSTPPGSGTSPPAETRSPESSASPSASAPAAPEDDPAD